MGLLRFVGIVIASLILLVPVSSSGANGGNQMRGEDSIDVVYEYSPGVTFKSVVTELINFDFDALTQVTIIHVPTNSKPRSEKTYTNACSLKKANALLDFTPADCHSISQASSGWTEVIIFHDANGGRFGIQGNGKQMKVDNIIYVDYLEEDIYAEIRKLFP